MLSSRVGIIEREDSSKAQNRKLNMVALLTIVALLWRLFDACQAAEAAGYGPQIYTNPVYNEIGADPYV